MLILTIQRSNWEYFEETTEGSLSQSQYCSKCLYTKKTKSKDSKI